MEITKGKIQKAKKVVIYGPEGIGKSTFAARFPGAVFIDTEGSTNDMDVAMDSGHHGCMWRSSGRCRSLHDAGLSGRRCD